MNIDNRVMDMGTEYLSMQVASSQEDNEYAEDFENINQLIYVFKIFCVLVVSSCEEGDTESISFLSLVMGTYFFH